MTQDQWRSLEDLLPAAKRGGRPRTTDLKEVINAIFYINRVGCAWRYLPKDFPPWQSVYRYFRFFQNSGLWQAILIHLEKQLRIKCLRSASPGVLIIDAQSVKAHYGEERGYDGFKKVRGRKREILVDSLGIVLSCSVHAANQSENRRAIEAITHYRTDLLARPRAILGDSAYGKAPFDIEVFRHWGFWPKTIKGEKTHHFISNLKPQRWIVERSFAWMNNFRRLARDYERKVTCSEAFIYICALQIVLKRLLPP